MDIQYRSCSIFGIDAVALVNPVNCVGISGNGLALQFKKKYPDNFKAYEDVCFHKVVGPGALIIYQNTSLVNPQYIVNFTTKAHWKGNSHIDWIHSGMTDLCMWIANEKITSIAIPMLGCGQGGLDWMSLVKPAILDELKQIESESCTVSLMV